MEVKIKVLIVDDDLRNLRILEEILSDEFELEEAANGSEALIKASEFMPDIILLDIMMPDMDGLEVCKRIRENNKLNYIKIILVSGKAKQDDKLEGYEAGADDYITKPFDDDELLAKVKVFAKLKFSQEIDLLKTNFLDLLSHETGTPLNAITGFSMLLKNTPGFTEEVYESLDMIHDAGKNLADKIDRLLFLTSIRNKSNEEEKMSIPIDELISASLDFTEKKKQDKNIEIEILNQDLSMQDIQVAGCFEYLQKALFYIFENAVKFSEENSKITIETKISDDHKFCDIAVKDTGPGINDNLGEKLFEEFNIPSILSHQNGLGISIAISKRIVEMHNGTISAKNNDDIGATFTISLPLELND